MKKRILYAFAISGVLGTLSASALPLGEFRGVFYVTSTTGSGCSSATGFQWFLRYFPPNVGPNGPGTDFTIDGASLETYSYNFHLDSGSIVSKTPLPVKLTGLGQGGYQAGVSMAITSQTPKTITATTHEVSMKGTIVDMYGAPDCTITFIATAYNY
jgi:hypothetical protein